MRLRLSILLGVVLLAVLGAGGYVVHAHRVQDAARRAAPPVPTTGLSAIAGTPHLVFRSTALGQGYGKVATVSLADPGGARAFTPISCDRIYAKVTGAICLVAKRGLVTTYQTQLLTPQWTVQKTLPAAGLPSRARLSPDGSLAATTTFVFGDSYTNPGQFSTRTVIIDRDGKTLADIEKFRLTVDGRVITAIDKNLWGVTFANDDTFYATAASGGHTWLVRGSVSGQSLTALRGDVECPSLSPDGTRIAFKKHGDLPPGQWRLAVYDLRSGAETLLAEQHSVDDQAEWLDNDTVLYGLPRSGATATSDIWAVPADGSGSPRLFVSDASSPAVVR